MAANKDANVLDFMFSLEELQEPFKFLANEKNEIDGKQ
jgi:hypothetical protein